MTVLAEPALRPGHVAADPVVGLRVHTHAPVTAAWVDATALPVWERAQAGGRSLVALRRGWRGGPHVEIVGVGPVAHETDWAALAPSVDAGPGPAEPLGAEAYLDQARELGRLEDVPPPYLPLHPHGAVRVVRRSEVERAGRPLDPLRGVVHASLAPAVVETLRVVAAAPPQLPTCLLQVLTRVAAAHAMGPGFGTFSLRSHAEAMLSWLSPRADLREAFSRRWTEQRAAVVPVVAAALDGTAGRVPAAWAETIAYCRGVVDETVRRGELDSALLDEVGRREPGREGPPGAATTPVVGQESLPDTDFHRTVDASGATDAAGPWFAGYRFLVNCVYAQLPLLDVAPLQRAYGCYAVAEAVDVVLGQRWTERLAVAATEARGGGSDD